MQHKPIYIYMYVHGPAWCIYNIYIQGWMYSTCLEYLDYSRLVAATFRKTEIGRLFCWSVADFSYVHGSWMSSCLVCRCCVFMFWERRARLHDFGLGQSSMLTVSPESSDVTHQVQQFQGQWMAINPKDVFILCIYIYIRERGFQYILDYTTLYPSWCPFIYLISPSLGALYPYQMKWMAQSPLQALLQGGFRLQGPSLKVVWFRLPDWGQWSKPW